jgi:hypothetical protein
VLEVVLELRRRPLRLLERMGQLLPVQQLPSAVHVGGHAVLHQCFGLDDAHTLDRDRHHDAREAGPRFPQLERLHRLARSAELGREFGQPRRETRLRWVVAELAAELRVDEQPLDQLARAGGLVVSG